MITLAGFVVTAITPVVRTVQSRSPRLVGALHHIGRFLLLFALLVGTRAVRAGESTAFSGKGVPRAGVAVSPG